MKERQCFVIMPISDIDGYDNGHFGRVYEHLIKPACGQAGFQPILASEVLQTNYIAIDILKRLIEAEMAICDLSGRNPNVLYELGLRHAFKLPVALIKDEITERVFDIQGFRDTPYDSSLRIDSVQSNIQAIAETLRSTHEATDDVNSLVGLLGVQPASITKTTTVSTDTQLILGSLQSIELRLSDIEKSNARDGNGRGLSITPQISQWENTALMSAADLDGLKSGDTILHERFGEGRVLEVQHANPENPKAQSKATIFFPKAGQKQLLLQFANLRKPMIQN